MADDIDLDLEPTDEEQDKVNKVEKRIKDLSEKVKLTAQERDDLAKAKQQLETEKADALKEVDFFKNFSPLTSKYPAAGEYQDKIREKVMAGYDVEDATISVLAKEGKLTPASVPTPPKENPAGGSATTTLKSGEPKPLAEMSRDEKREALVEAFDKGEISL